MPTPTKKVRVLFIDDDGSIRIFTEAMFNNHLFDIKVAASTREADQLIKLHSFDVIVCDVMMPEEDGIRYCNRLKKAGSSIPFLFLSAVGNPEMAEMGLKVGANAYFVKPFDARDLQNKILSLLPAFNKKA